MAGIGEPAGDRSGLRLSLGTPNGALYADRLGTITTASAIMVMTEKLRG
jgi:hypothetical protein